MKRNFLILARNAWLPAVLLAFAAAPASAQTLSAIYVMKLEGGEVRKVSHRDDRWLGSPAWSHDGKRLLYDAAPANRNYRQGRIMLENLKPADKAEAGRGRPTLHFKEAEANEGARPSILVRGEPGEGARPSILDFGIPPSIALSQRERGFAWAPLLFSPRRRNLWAGFRR